MSGKPFYEKKEGEKNLTAEMQIKTVEQKILCKEFHFMYHIKPLWYFPRYSYLCFTLLGVSYILNVERIM